MKLSSQTKLLKERDIKIIRDIPFETMSLCGDDAGVPTLSFVEDKKYVSSLSPHISMLLTTKAVYEECEDQLKDIGIAFTSKPRQIFWELHNTYHDMEYTEQDFPSEISNKSNISLQSYIAKKNVIIEDNVTIEPFVCIHENVIIREGSVIRSGAQIGGWGFQFIRGEKEVMSVNHYGKAEIGKNVEIQHNSCVDRAIFPWDSTKIGDNTKIDNLVHIAHCVKIGNGVMIAAGANIAGSVRIKDNSWIGIGVTINNRTTIGEKARANIGSVVAASVPDYGSVTGNFAIEHKKFLKKMILDQRL